MATKKPDIRFLVTISDDAGNRFGGTQFRDFTARAYILDIDRYSDNGPELHSPDSYAIDAGWARVLAGLEIHAQADSGTMARPGREWYGWSVQYNRHRVALKDAEEILPVLRKIKRRIEKLTAELGAPTSLAQLCAYAVSALTAERHVFMCGVKPELDYEGTGRRSMDVNALSYYIDADAAEWRKAHGIDPAA